MCMRSPKISLPNPTAVRTQTADAIDPEPVKFGGASSWDKASKDKGISALKVSKPDETLSDSLKKRRSAGVNYF